MKFVKHGEMSLQYEVELNISRALDSGCTTM